MEHSRRNVFLLACCQALLLTNAVTLIAISALAGYALVENKALATLPATTYVIGGMMGAFPAPMGMNGVGRRNGVLTGGALGPAGRSPPASGTLPAALAAPVGGTVPSGAL